MNQYTDLTILEERVASYPDSVDDIHILADAYADQDRWGDAVKSYKAAIALDAGNVDLYNSLGTAFEKLGDLEEAEYAYRQAIDLGPSNSIACHNLGTLCEDQQRIPEAITAYRKCLEHSTDSDERSTVGKRLSTLLPEDEKVVQTSVTQRNVLRMHERIRSWATTSLIFGGLSIFAGGTFDPVWGVVMIVLAILSWKVKVPAMFILYAAFMGWAAVSNAISVLTGGDIWWGILVLVQISWTVSIFKEFKQYSRLPLQELFEAGDWPATLGPPQNGTVIAGRFAIAGAVLAALSIVLLPLVLVASFALSFIAETSQTPQILIWLLSGSVDIAVLALGLSGAALLSKTERKIWAIGGVVISALVLIGWLGFLLVIGLA
ncbi:MAG: tetratricopeptide repeat protein [Chloroflexi bacterium]|nr:tetratricopeptide repeat protein [Chloroflexota bacterium]